MTCSTDPVAPKEASIQIADGDGTQIRSVSSRLPPQHPPTQQEVTRHPLARLIAIAGLIAAVAFPAYAQDGIGPMPTNAQPRSYGSGWVCDLGYRVEGADCLALDIPEHAYPTGRSYGTGWECDRGFEEVSGTSCDPIPVPDNAFLRSSGFDWQCERGFRQVRDACVPIVLPEFAYLTEESSGTEWACNRGYSAVGVKCTPIAVPANAYLTNATYGAAWVCERGFVKVNDRCDAIILPANAFLDQSSNGPGWSCERGYEPLSGACVAIDLPKNAFFDRSGNRWSCNQGFQLSDGACILAR
ncbi:hypothetical protein EU803_16970 [Loktanella sp. IMCC34160]|uniref:hypothetical protein n=1 Tax=Loktanella sp. IMCC34160 TaxID=2510646 RepID=UPI00101B83DB|nr:hypothetical protein [Loktanella sp. IMCC34160]RYG89426.1 hypothetical protein EU803_16970 [Loktanella sp. IMCC34160]